MPPARPPAFPDRAGASERLRSGVVSRARAGKLLAQKWHELRGRREVGFGEEDFGGHIHGGQSPSRVVANQITRCTYVPRLWGSVRAGSGAWVG